MYHITYHIKCISSLTEMAHRYNQRQSSPSLLF